MDFLDFFSYRPALIGIWIACLFVVSARFPLRTQQGRLELRHGARNLSLGVLTEVAQRILSGPVIALLAPQVLRLPGLLPAAAPTPLRVGAGVLILDGILYFWHRLNHQLPFLWRFHRIHHSDPAMDASTSVRFHPVEFLLSAGVTLLQLTVIRGDVLTYFFYDVCVTLAVPFHHSNWRLPGRLDFILHRLIVTPESHGIHHSIFPAETDSNYGTLFSLWDRLFRTTRGRRLGSKVQTGISDPPPESLFELISNPFRISRNKP